MAVRRKKIQPDVSGDGLPDFLRSSDVDPARWIPSDEEIESRFTVDSAADLAFYRKLLRGRNFRLARSAYLADLEVQPAGVSDMEWHKAHGMTHIEAKAASR